MIFVTTGTHEQQFDRLISAVDKMAVNSEEEYFVQYGYETKKPSHAKGEMLIAREKMNELLTEARIVVTHGGPGSIWACFGVNKIPIVVPRQHRFAEHVNDHQLVFCRRLAEAKKIILVEDIGTLKSVIDSYTKLVSACALPGQASKQNRTAFCLKLSALV